MVMQTSITLKASGKALTLPKVNLRKIAGIVAGIASVAAYICAVIDTPAARTAMFVAVLVALPTGVTYVMQKGGEL